MSANTGNNLLISEVLQKVSNAKTKSEKIKLLTMYNSNALRSILIWNYDETIITLLPEGEVPYTPNDSPKGTDHTVLEREYRKLYYYLKGGADDVPQLRRESMFIALLEGLHAEEAELLCLVKDRKLQDKYRITLATVKEAFPQIEWGNRGPS
ncbi:gp225 [Synechococcus phage S-CBM2]|nr:gp225 [Synechococcus phage S-CBM2]